VFENNLLLVDAAVVDLDLWEATPDGLLYFELVLQVLYHSLVSLRDAFRTPPVLSGRYQEADHGPMHRPRGGNFLSIVNRNQSKRIRVE
jgi:hypothetical protein